MYTIITNHYLPEITQINHFIIHYKNVYINNIYNFLNFKDIFSKRQFYNLGRAHRKKFYRECFETRHICSMKGSVQDDDFMLHKRYDILKLLWNISPKPRDFFRKKYYFLFNMC